MAAQPALTRERVELETRLLGVVAVEQEQRIELVIVRATGRLGVLADDREIAGVMPRVTVVTPEVAEPGIDDHQDAFGQVDLAERCDRHPRKTRTKKLKSGRAEP